MGLRFSFDALAQDYVSLYFLIDYFGTLIWDLDCQDSFIRTTSIRRRKSDPASYTSQVKRQASFVINWSLSSWSGITLDEIVRQFRTNRRESTVTELWTNVIHRIEKNGSLFISRWKGTWSYLLWLSIWVPVVLYLSVIDEVISVIKRIGLAGKPELFTDRNVEYFLHIKRQENL